jgi:hypothetical protein
MKKKVSTRSSAREPLKKLSEFYISWTFALPIYFKTTRRLSTKLQGKKVSTGQGVELQHQATAELRNLCSGQKFAKLWNTELNSVCSVFWEAAPDSIG